MIITHPVNKENIFEEFLRDDFAFNMVKVNGGTFIMGDNNSQYDDEKPEHEVTISDFYIGQYPVTNEQFAVFLNESRSTEIELENGKNHIFIYSHKWGVQKINGYWQPARGFEHYPIINVTWHGALEFCHWLSQKTKKSYRLPSEAEWEYAARGGNNSKGFIFSGSHKLNEVGWFNKNSYGETKQVGLKLPNELGVYDMSGNIYEWCADYWHENYKYASNDISAWQADGDAIRRVVRGGSWLDIDFICRVSSRHWLNDSLKSEGFGFRLARH